MGGEIQPVLDSQSAFLTTPQEKAAYLETVLSTHLKTGDGTNFGQALEWAVKPFVETDRPTPPPARSPRWPSRQAAMTPPALLLTPKN